MGKPFMLIVYGAIAVVVALVMFGVAIVQLGTAITTANTSTALYPGLVSVIGVFGIVIFITLIGSGLAMIGGGVYQTVRSGTRRHGRR